MDIRSVLPQAQTVLQALNSPALVEFVSHLSFKPQLEQLKNTIITIISIMLNDAKELQLQRSNEEQDWVEKLSDAIYDVDDLLDEIAYVAQRKQLMMSGDTTSKEVRHFFPRFKQLMFALSMSREIKKIRKRLDNFITEDSRGSSFMTSTPPLDDTRSGGGDDLELPLKRCLRLCALFPKDHKIDKRVLVSLWMAHGLIQPSQGLGVEDVGEKYFTTLLQKSVFRDVDQDDLGDIESCKVNHLMNDVTQEEATKEIFEDSATRKFDKNTRHLGFSYTGGFTSFLRSSINNEMKTIRTLFVVGGYSRASHMFPPLRIENVLSSLPKARSLRVLVLNDTGLRRMPKTIDKMVHLRYLDLSHNGGIEFLQVSLTKLINLQSLRLQGCRYLKELPRELRELVNLKYLDIDGCDRLTNMPSGMNNMTNLERLTRFVVGVPSEGNNKSKQAQAVGQLEDLEALSKQLRGNLEIKIVKFEISRVRKVGHVLKDTEHVKRIAMTWDERDQDSRVAEALMEGLQPHPNARAFELRSYPSKRFPTWASLKNFEISLPNLVVLSISECSKLQHLPLLGQLRHLKSLSISKLDNLEYIEGSSRYDGGGVGPNTASASTTFFPSLEALCLESLPQLKEWYPRSSSREANQNHESHIHAQPQILYFPRLLKLQVNWCPKRTFFILSPNFETIHLHTLVSLSNPVQSSKASSSNSSSNLKWKVKQLKMNDVGVLNYLPLESFHYLSELVITEGNMESLRNAKEVFRGTRLSSSLKSLTISFCRKLKKLSGGGLEHLTALESLSLSGLPMLEMADEEEFQIPWKSLGKTLRRLTLSELPKLVTLPRGFEFLTCLQTLEITSCYCLKDLPEGVFSCLASLQYLKLSNCCNLKSLPNAMRRLTSLTKLEIWDCYDLAWRCLAHCGEDWPKIQHIPCVSIISPNVSFDDDKSGD